MAAAPATRLLLVLPLPLHACGDTLWLDTQACNGLRLWLDNFEAVTMVNPLLRVAVPPPATAEVRALLPTARLELLPLPAAWTPLAFLRALPAARATLTAAMARASHLQFAIGGLWGDWGAVATLIAARRGRAAAVWTDRVESEVMRQDALRQRGLSRIARRINAALAHHFERHVIARAAMGLFHGADTFNTYARYSRDPHVVHDIHLGPEARIAPDALAAKVARRDGPVRLVYGGRAHPDKGVLDWVEACGLLAASGIDFTATWFGDGPELAAARARVAALGIGARVALPGPTDDRASLMAAFREADLFLFCHRTPESPRCLVEALLSGTPIVGYESAYPRELIATHAGGVLTPHQPAAAAAAVATLARDRARLAALIAAAAQDGYPYVDEDVFRHRSDLIKRLG